MKHEYDIQFQFNGKWINQNYNNDDLQRIKTRLKLCEFDFPDVPKRIVVRMISDWCEYQGGNKIEAREGNETEAREGNETEAREGNETEDENQEAE